MRSDDSNSSDEVTVIDSAPPGASSPSTGLADGWETTSGKLVLAQVAAELAEEATQVQPPPAEPRFTADESPWLVNMRVMRSEGRVQRVGAIRPMGLLPILAPRQAAAVPNLSPRMLSVQSQGRRAPNDLFDGPPTGSKRRRGRKASTRLS